MQDRSCRSPQLGSGASQRIPPYRHRAQALVPAKTRAAIPFCIGPIVRGVPAGLIIYATRNQYNHWDDEPHEVSRRVFDALSAAFYNNALYDLAFEIDDPGITVHANEVLLGALGWKTYERYEAEIRSMLT